LVSRRLERLHERYRGQLDEQEDGDDDADAERDAPSLCHCPVVRWEGFERYGRQAATVYREPQKSERRDLPSESARVQRFADERRESDVVVGRHSDVGSLDGAEHVDDAAGVFQVVREDGATDVGVVVVRAAGDGQALGPRGRRRRRVSCPEGLEVRRDGAQEVRLRRVVGVLHEDAPALFVLAGYVLSRSMTAS